MKNTKKIILGLGTLAVVLGVAGSASAYRGDPAVKGPNYSPERHTAMEKAFEMNDYNAWKALMTNGGRVMQIVNSQNFAKFAEAHKLAEKGDIAGAQKIRQDLGLGLKNGLGKGNGKGLNRGNRINN
jgi:hypothetical protein